MKFKGTKGKWKVEEHPLYYWEVVSETDLICVVSEQGEEGKANALLISKAPEMLDMLIKIHRTTLDEDIKAQVELLIKEETEL